MGQFRTWWALPTLALLAACWLPARSAVAQRTPLVERVEPTAASAGDEVRVLGRGLQSVDRVELSGVPVHDLRVASHWLRFSLPAQARSGDLVLWVGEHAVQRRRMAVLPSPPAPVITRVEPLRVSPGQVVTVYGEGFSVRPGHNQVRLGDSELLVVDRLPHRLRVVVPASGSGGRLQVAVRGASDHALSARALTLLKPLRVRELQPAHVVAGRFVRVLGDGFHSDPDANIVRIGTRLVDVLQASPTELVVQVPLESPGGRVSVGRSAGAVARSEQVLQVSRVPTARKLSASVARVGDRLLLHGDHLVSPGPARTVRVGGIDVPALAVEGGSLEVTVPEGARSGPVELLSGADVLASWPALRVLPPMRITAVRPARVAPGQVVTVRGQGLSAQGVATRAWLGDRELEVLDVSDSRVRLRVGDHDSGLLKLTLLGASSISAAPVLVLRPPRVLAVAPAAGQPGAMVEIRARNLPRSSGELSVRLGGRPMEIERLEGDRVTVVVPDGAQSGPIELAVAMQGSCRSARPFRVLAPFYITEIDRSTASPGDSVVIFGDGFVAHGMRVRFGRLDAVVERLSFSELRVVVPQGAAKGPVTVLHPDGRQASSPGDFLPDRVVADAGE